jgi:Zn-dependent protease/predicted transcriptional regulator
MTWSWRVGRIAGIELYVHPTFILLLAWVAMAHYLERKRWEDVASGLLFIVTLFGIVVLHELGHALTARRFGIRTRDITLLPIGGVARLERMPEDPKQEFLVALAGPAVNVVLAVILSAILVPVSGMAVLANVAVVGGPFLAKLIWVNVALALFNLLPAFPMDGGRVLRALLAMRMNYVKATQIAASIGQAMALLFGFAGLFVNPFLVFIALFVWIGAAQEAAMVQMKAALGGIPVQQVMITNYEALSPNDPLQRAVERILAGFQQDFPVLQDNRVVGVLTRADLLHGLTQHGPDFPVEKVMQHKFEVAEPSEMLESVFARLQSSACHSMPVTRNGRLVGIMSQDNIGEFLMIQSALQAQTG